MVRYKTTTRVRRHGGPKSDSDVVRLDRLSESAKGCGLAEMPAAESAGIAVSITGRETVATALRGVTIERLEKQTGRQLQNFRH